MEEIIEALINGPDSQLDQDLKGLLKEAETQEEWISLMDFARQKATCSIFVLAALEYIYDRKPWVGRPGRD